MTYAQVYKRREDIRESVFEDRTMPKDGPLTPAQEDLLKRWLDADAPEYEPVTGQPDPDETPTPSPSPAPSDEPPPSPTPSVTPPNPPGPGQEVTFATIKKEILVPRCLNCHAPGGEEDDVPLGTLKEILDSKDPLIIPGQPEKSWFLDRLKKRDDDQMPPLPKKPLTDDQIQMVEDWIRKGAPE